ncbi:Lactonase, 7-bladed beta-propeller-domain-containing protein [Xylariaceae sp. FL0662B]|nr:Lactonase, 7-bladed beta-propeller-domain-containing protein [Xylariaceae sp. FL0662B]
MNFLQAFLVLASFMALAMTAKHQIIVGSFPSKSIVGTSPGKATEYLYTVEYDDADQSLELVAKIPTAAANSWITFSHDKKNLYGTDWNAEQPTFVSYSVENATAIKQEATIVGGEGCSGAKSVFAIANPEPPYSVYGNYFYGDAKCGTVFSVDANGTLDGVLQNFTYADGAAVHGAAFSADAKYLYSADDGGNCIWSHTVDLDTGELSYPGQSDAPSEGSDPRHIVVHPKGQYLYVVLEGSSEVAQYATDRWGGLTLKGTWPLIEEGEKAGDYWADEVALSANSRYLWASNRARDAAGKNGYISVFSLGAKGDIEKQLELTRTSSSGGFANAVAPSPFDDDVAALTDNSTGFVEIWKRGQGVLARLDIKDDGGGCCANAVWYS